MDIIARLRAAITPWCQWSLQGVYRAESLTDDVGKESLGDVRRLQIQWLGMHFAIELGRTPPAISDAEAARRRARIAAFQAQYRQGTS